MYVYIYILYINDTLLILHVAYIEVMTVLHGDMYSYSVQSISFKPHMYKSSL
jgi:hypothetical protein